MPLSQKCLQQNDTYETLHNVLDQKLKQYRNISQNMAQY